MGSVLRKVWGRPKAANSLGPSGRLPSAWASSAGDRASRRSGQAEGRCCFPWWQPNSQACRSWPLNSQPHFANLPTAEPVTNAYEIRRCHWLRPRALLWSQGVPSLTPRG